DVYVFVVTYIISFLRGFLYLLMLLNVYISRFYASFTCAKFESINIKIRYFSWIMLTKVYIAQNAFEQALVILN
ncbi:hypothetical protein, partial [Clostridium sp.]|uniref:hypothetical protein n=1 Tax=Clostridium sp. TaxID=1506 RepID=UPI003D6C9A62